MKDIIQDALLSVGEVLAFAWSLLELLLTRIFPLAGFLLAHLLLQFGRLLGSVVIPTTAPHHKIHRPENSGDVQADEIFEGDNVLAPLLGKIDGDHENDVEDLQGSDPLEAEDADLLTDAAADDELHVVDLVPSNDGTNLVVPVAAGNDVDVHGSDGGNMGETAANEVQLRTSDDIGMVANEMQQRGNVDGHMTTTKPSNLNIAGGEQGHVLPKVEGSGGKMILESLDEKTSTSSSQESTSPSGGGAGRGMRTSKRMMRVLPPSLSQIRRTLMQRSRRGTPSPPIGSPAITTPSPIKKKPHRRRSPAVIKSSTSYDNFMSKFRNHFLLDPA